jgi:phosphoadenosine phosphosulfate reductase
MKTTSSNKLKISDLLDLDNLNQLLGSLSATDRINWAVNTFNSGLYALTSAGTDSALMLDHISKAKKPIPVIHINTGFLPQETIDFKNKLKQKYGFLLYEFSPSKQQIKDINNLKLWDGDLPLYSKITKLDPLTKAIAKLKVVALLSGVRADQTDNRAELAYIGKGNDGELRIHPFLDWSKTEVEEYISKHGLPRNQLHKKGYESVGDKYTTNPGQNREGRTVMECGLHVVGGKLVKRTSIE